VPPRTGRRRRPRPVPAPTAPPHRHLESPSFGGSGAGQQLCGSSSYGGAGQATHTLSLSFSLLPSTTLVPSATSRRRRPPAR
jgi:hypothetical protein